MSNLAFAEAITSSWDNALTCPICTQEGKVCVRCQMYERLPKWRSLQALLTFIVGVPYPGQCPYFRNSPSSITYASFCLFSGTILTNAVMVAFFPYASAVGKSMLACGILAMSLVSSGCFRALHQFLKHHSMHGALSKTVGSVALMLAGTMSNEDYDSGHDRHHSHLTNDDDPDQRAVAALGFVPGKSYLYYWFRLAIVLLSPYFFIRFLGGRAKSLFAKSQPLIRQLHIAALHGGLLCMCLAGSWLYNSYLPISIYLFAWGLPITYGMYCSLVFDSLSLHRWWHRTEHDTKGRDAYLAKTGARFFGDSCPPKNLPLIHGGAAWLWWWMRLILLHGLFSKMFSVGPTDGQHHDAHHADPRGRFFDFTCSAYSRNDMIRTRDFSTKLWHTWSLFDAIRANFRRLESLPPLVGELTPQERNLALDHLQNM